MFAESKVVSENKHSRVTEVFENGEKWLCDPQMGSKHTQK